MKHVLILGGGFAGVRVALDLLKEKELKITLVNDSPFHCYQPDLYEVATTTLKHNNKLVFENLLGTVNIPLTTIFPHGVRILVDKVLSVDLEEKKVKCQKEDLNYDILVVALGSTTSYFNIPGAFEHSHPMKNAEDALNIHNDLDELVNYPGHLPDNPVSKRPQVVVAGGGFTGVELVGNLVDYLGNKAKITIIEGTDHLMGGMPEWAQKEALEKLTALGIEVKLNSLIAEVKDDKIQIKDGDELSFDYLVWTTGVKGIDLKGKGVIFNPRGQIVTQSDLSVAEHSNVFVVGDMAGLEKVPQAAWAAEAEAKVASANILAKINKRSLSDFVAPASTFVVPIGKDKAVSNYMNLKIKGSLGWLLKRLVALKYFLSILPPLKAIKLFLRGVEVYPR